MMLTIKPGETEQADKFTHSLRNLHGDVFVTADGNGANTSDGSGPANSFQYDPFGVTLSTSPDNTQTGTFGWIGRAQKTTETDLTLAPVQMGARVYVPGLGRFLQVDPVEGGTLNNYVYALDSVNQYDLSGEFIVYIIRAINVIKSVNRSVWSNVKSGWSSLRSGYSTLFKNSNKSKVPINRGVKVNPPKKIIIEPKINKQLSQRGWTRERINEAVKTPVHTVRWFDRRHIRPGQRVDDPAIAYYHRDGGYVVINNVNGKVVQIQNLNKKDWIAPWD